MHHSTDTIFSRAVDQIYTQLDVMTNNLVSSCEHSPTLSHTVSAMIAEAGEAAIQKFKSKRYV